MLNKFAIATLLFLVATTASAKPPLATTQQPAPKLASVRLAIEDLMKSFPKGYEQGEKFLARADELSKQPTGADRDAAIKQLQREALLANPLLDFQELLLIRRKSGRPGLPANWQGNESLPKTGYNNDIVALPLNALKKDLRTVYRPESDVFVGDLDLHFGGKRLLFSMPGKNGAWQTHELEVANPGVATELPLIPDPDVDCYDACYLPDGDILFTSTATFTGVPCVGGKSHVANIYRFGTQTGEIRRLTFDQEHNWDPTVLNNGRIMYLRWEYSDLPHFASRILFHMNPDGTNQAAHYGSSSYWPNSFFYGRPVPNHPTQVAGIVSGHHGSKRAGELLILDPARGRHEADGAVQRIPGYGKKVEPVILDKLVDASWPKFLHPQPLSTNYFIVAGQLSSKSPWAIYLVDVFDNMLLLREEPGFDLFEPVPLRSRSVPPALPNRVDVTKKDATIYLENIYVGPGLKGVPKGTVKNLRLVTYRFAYRGMGGQNDRVGLDGPWDVKCVLGTVPVEADGSALFDVPANTPIAFQPLDEEGKAIQLMRSWSTAMPGERVSCIGCHESQNHSPSTKSTTAVRKAPSKILPWHGPTRGFSFKREVEPVVTAHCAECHNAKAKVADGKEAQPIKDAYMFLRQLVRTPTMEPDLHVCEPYEFHADTTELVRMLKTGHHGVKLDAESWDRIVTWIDLNTPRYGTWIENVGEKRMSNRVARRRDLMERYAGISGVGETPDEVANIAAPPVQIASARGKIEDTEPLHVEVLQLKELDGKPEIRVVDLGDGRKLELALIPAGEFRSGTSTVKIAKPFWMATKETTNELFTMFDPKHDSRLEPNDFLHFSTSARGAPLNGAQQPVAKVSWKQAVEYCDWLSKETGLTFQLPTEGEWEWACRAGSKQPFWYGDATEPFSTYANLADQNFFKSSHSHITKWRPSILAQNDGHRVSSPVGAYQANPWGLYDMHGNVAEWTSSEFQSDQNQAATKRTVRGGSWSERPKWAGADARWGYPEFQKVYNVGFRVIVRE